MARFTSWEELGKRYRKKMRTLSAKFAGVCPQCHNPIKIGDTIVQPFSLNEHKVNRFSNCWYCARCGEHFQRGVDCGYHAQNGYFLTIADMEAFHALPDVVAYLAECEAIKTCREAKKAVA